MSLKTCGCILIAVGAIHACSPIHAVPYWVVGVDMMIIGFLVVVIGWREKPDV